MPRADDSADLGCRWNAVSGACDWEEDRLRRCILSEIAADRVRNHHRVVLHLGLPESIHAFLERSNHGKWQAAQLDRLADCIVNGPVEFLGHFLGDYADLVAG